MDDTFGHPVGPDTPVEADPAVSYGEPAQPPSDAPCWAGDWSRVDVRTQVWGQAAVLRTVSALPATHPWRLGGSAGSIRQVQWTGRPATVPDGVVCILSVTAIDPNLSSSETEDGSLSDVVQRLSLAREQRWAGALVQLPGTWLPAAALLPRGIPGVPAPRTHFGTESLDFDQRWVIHSEDEQVTSALLSPAAMAVLMDAVPRGSAVTVSGDALQIWWPYDDSTRSDIGRVQRAALAALLLVKSFPRFVLADHPDRSMEMERSLARKADEAQEYREHASFGHSPDPVLQRIYDQARQRAGV